MRASTVIDLEMIEPLPRLCPCHILKILQYIYCTDGIYLSISLTSNHSCQNSRTLASKADCDALWSKANNTLSISSR